MPLNKDTKLDSYLLKPAFKIIMQIRYPITLINTIS